MTTITELARLAEAATPGPWAVHGDVLRWVSYINDGGSICQCEGTFDRAERNAAYIAAADPQTILGLLRELAEAKAKITKLEGSLGNISTKVLQESTAVFAMWPEGVTSIDAPKLEAMAKRTDSGSAFFATVILQVLASIEAGHMKNVSPEQIVVRRKL